MTDPEQLSQLLEEYRERKRHGEVDVEGLCGGQAELAAALRAQIRKIEEMEAFLGVQNTRALPDPGVQPGASGEESRTAGGAEAPGLRVTLTVVAGPSQGRQLTFDRHDFFLVGRSPAAHFSVPDDPYFSRNHFLLEINPPLCRLVDLRSRNGTLVNGQRLETAGRDLVDGDQIEAGRTRLHVRIEKPHGPDQATLDLPAPESASGTLPLEEGAARTEPVTEGTAVEGAPGTHPASPEEEMPETLGSYQLLRRLGKGGMGAVYLGLKEVGGSPVALKTFLPAVRPTPTAVARFLREVEILEQLVHPNIVRLLETGESDGRLYFAMEYVAGVDLAGLVRRHGRLEVGRAARLACQLLDALGYAHSLGFVHRDIKPSNVLVSTVAGAETVKLADFGLARTYQASQLSGLTMTGSTAGTPFFMAPEQVTDFRSVQPAADQYAVAATLYYLLSAQHVYPACGSTIELLMKVLNEEPTPVTRHRDDLPAGLASAIGRALSRTPEARFPNVAHFRQAILPFAEP